MLLVDGSASLSLTPCRPYRSLRLTRTPFDLQDLLQDSVHIPMELGLGIETPILGAGVTSCAVGHNPFAEGTSDFLFDLAIHSVGPVPDDSIRGEWRIYFRETRRDLNGPFAGTVVQDTLDLALHMGGDSFVECEPGYRLRIALDPGQRLADGDLETLRPEVTVGPGAPAGPPEVRPVPRAPPRKGIGSTMNVAVRILAVVILFSGCGSEPDDRIFGTYVLVGVEGNPLPYLATSDADCDVFIAEGELTLNEGGTYTMEFMGPLDCSRSGGPSDQSVGRQYVGTFTESGGTLQFKGPLQGGGTLEFTGTVNPLEARVTAPPIPPQTGPDLDLQFAVSP